jgi:hypothetical protein
MKPPKRQRNSINKAQTTQRSAAKRQKTTNYVKNQTTHASADLGNPPGVFTPLYETVVLSEVVGSGFTIAPVDGLKLRC